MLKRVMFLFLVATFASLVLSIADGRQTTAQDGAGQVASSPSQSPAKGVASSTTVTQSDQPTTAAETPDGGPARDATELTRFLGLPITNSMLVTWIVAVGLIGSAQLATRKMEMVPTGLQNFWEWVVERLHGFLEQIIGQRLVEKAFWLFATIFIFILAANWAGLVPGVGPIGWGYASTDGFVIDRPLLRGATADLNLTLHYNKLRQENITNELLDISGGQA